MNDPRMTDTGDHTCSRNDDAVALALHVLEPEEEIAVRTHLPHCRSCRETVRSTELAMGSLATSVRQINPPAGLRSSIMAQIADTPQDAGTTGSSRASHRHTRREPASRPAARPARSRRRVVAVSLTAAALLVFGGLTTYAVQVQQQRDAQIEQTQALVDLLTRSGAPGTTRATLQTDTGRAMAVVLIAPAGRTVVTAAMPPNQRDSSTYVLWGIDGAGPHPLGAFDVLPGTAAYPLAGTDTSFTAYAVSLEPGRVMPAVPTTVVAGGPVQA